MDRREFCKKIGLVSASLGISEKVLAEGNPEVEQKLEYWELKPDDIVILSSPVALSGMALLSLRNALEEEFPENKILILTDGLKIQIIHKKENKL